MSSLFYEKKRLSFHIGRWENLSLAMQRSRGTGPRATGKNATPHRRARACPSPCLAPPNNRGGQAPALREKRMPLRSRGTGPRATMKKTPALTKQKTPPLTVGRGPVPRHASRTPTIAGDRPPRYGRRKIPFHRRARACPSPCLAHSNNRGGQAPALR